MTSIDLKTELLLGKLKPIGNIVLYADSVLNWEKPYHAPTLGSIITIIFMFFWLIDSSVLSKLCIVAICAIVLDFMLPALNGIVYKKQWTKVDESQFEKVCVQLATLWDNSETFYNKYYQLKYTNSKTYYVSLLTSLVILAWIGSIVHNLLLTYMIVLFLVLYPGLSKQDSFKRFIENLFNRLSSMVKSKDDSKLKTKVKKSL
ncbi:hypothetical protein RDWZM_005575 [Blomia tropicalis]|uniref:RETREG1-3/ARL6IP-like N-terminal reticulon-homology domain-containing protein n=1 Tax=Blomia tropicalis TaxID=40697 RepID=A0A9Q0M714_BLOTA|nr:ADP-ribosylation factor-like protein 6-interacting protein 1 [Blomia tropicalis]KAJ6219763.1 hypothetical protein RDWZM_005575 [Blomia tropicalis]